MNEQRNEYAGIAIVTVIYGLSLIFSEGRFVLFGSPYRIYFAIAMIILGLISLIGLNFKRWKVQGYLLMITAVSWSVIVSQYIAYPRLNSGWVTSGAILIYCIITLRRGVWDDF